MGNRSKQVRSAMAKGVRNGKALYRWNLNVRAKEQVSGGRGLDGFTSQLVSVCRPMEREAMQRFGAIACLWPVAR